MEVNPYQSPVEDAAPELGHESHFLASRGSRFAAALIDGIAIAIVVVPIQWSMGMFDNLARGGPDPGQTAIAGVIGFVLWFLIQVAFLRHGQTIGKKLLGIRIVDYTSGEVPPVSRIVLLRYLPVNIVAAIPTIGPLLNLVNILFIFGSEQRCVHDLIAGTKVVQA